MGISLGVVGLGAFGRCFADLFKAHPLVDRIAICDREPERMKPYADKESWRDKFDPRDCYPSLDEILKADLDAVAIITQPWLHAPQAVRAMEAGVNVYSAVPILCVPDGDEILEWCDRLVRTAEKTGMRYMLGETTCFRPEAMFCRRMAAARAFGDYVYSEGEYFHAFDSPGCDLRRVLEHRLASAAGREWLEMLETYKKRGATSGPMFYPTHSISGPISTMKAHAVKVSCFGQEPISDDPYFGDHQDVFSNETAIFQMTNGSVMRISEHRECALGRETFRVYGTLCAFEHSKWIDKFNREKNRTLTADEMRDPLPEEVLSAFQAINPESDAYGGHGGSHAYLVHEFVDAVAGDRHPLVNAWEAVRYMAAGVTAHKSALRDGEVLEVPDWGDAPDS